jgi:hypothetical protein
MQVWNQLLKTKGKARKPFISLHRLLKTLYFKINYCLEFARQLRLQYVTCAVGKSQTAVRRLCAG